MISSCDVLLHFYLMDSIVNDIDTYMSVDRMYREWSLNEESHSRVWLNFNDEYYRVFDHPSVIVMRPCSSKLWFKNGKLHRTTGPAYISYDKYGTIFKKMWYFNGKLYRKGAPATIFYWDEMIEKEIWYQNDLVHRNDGPAVVDYRKNGLKVLEQWFEDGKQQRKDGPAWVRYCDNCSKIEEIWYHDNKPCRYEGPYNITYDINGNQIHEI